MQAKCQGGKKIKLTKKQGVAIFSSVQFSSGCFSTFFLKINDGILTLRVVSCVSVLLCYCSLMTVKDLKKLVEYWVEMSSGDMQVARSLLKSRHYSYCLFFCHLAIEKTLKALVVARIRDHAPWTHNLSFLAGKADLTLDDKADVEFLSEMTRWNLEARYPADLEAMKKLINVDVAKGLFSKTEKFIVWLKRQLPKNY